jgi:hypothetical protein
MLLNVRCQRLDQWLVTNADMGIKVPVFFADYETSIYGRENFGRVMVSCPVPIQDTNACRRLRLLVFVFVPRGIISWCTLIYF